MLCTEQVINNLNILGMCVTDFSHGNIKYHCTFSSNENNCTVYQNKFELSRARLSQTLLRPLIYCTPLYVQ